MTSRSAAWRLRWVSSLAAIVALCFGASAASAAEPCPPGSTRALRDVHWQHSGIAHPLAGKVLKAGIALESGPCGRTPLHQLIAEIWETVERGGIVFLGEVHDNAEHHQVRGDIMWPRMEGVNEADGRSPAAVFEHIRTTHQPQIDQFYQLQARSDRHLGAADLLRALEWEQSGWPAAELFIPLFNDALRAKLPIVPGNPDRGRMRALIKDRSGASAEEAALLKLVDAVPPEMVQDLDAELEGSHCGVLPKAAIPPMSLAQRYTDAHLAHAAVAAAARHGGAFVLAGNGHVRADRGAPWHVRQLAPNTPVAAVMLIEVEDGKTEPTAYFQAGGRAAVADYIVFTPRQDRGDPCEKMRGTK